ncbi:MAG: hypothetical protein ABSG69_05560 [Candidatus Acidiferrum sp.]|jgi:hypothetical protein
MRSATLSLSLLLLTSCCSARGQSLSADEGPDRVAPDRVAEVAPERALPHNVAVDATGVALSADAPQTIVIGFMGGKVSHEENRNELVISKRLRASFPPDAYFAIFENRRLEDAHQEILHLLSSTVEHPLPEGLSGPLSDQEKRRARIVLYGHSWGASATVTLANELRKDGVPVLLTIQVDSVEKHGQNDAVIPDNVSRAINFYQPDGMLHGREEIRAANPARTQILGNYRYSYKDGDAPDECRAYPWFERVFIKTHIAIECDPVLWTRIEGLIREALSPKGETAAR